MGSLTEKRFYILLVINALLWVFVESLRTVVSRDSMEAVIWGELFSFGTNKHPPLSGWLAGGFYNLFQEHNFAIYLLGAVCVVVGLIYIYKLARFFLDEKKAICSSLIVATSFYYTFQIFYDNFNCNIISMALWPIMIYYFYKSLKFNKLKHWVIFGIVFGLSFMAKYQVIFLAFTMFLYMLVAQRKYFKEWKIYFSLCIAFLIVLPHIIWLVQNDWFSFAYLASRTQSVADTSVLMNIFHRIMFSLKFYIDQILALAPCLVLYIILVLKEKNVSFNFDKTNLKDKMFILSVGLFPLLLIGITGLFTASRVVGAWGVAMVGYIGVILFYFFPVKIKEETYNYFIKWIIGLLLAWQLAMAIFALAQTKIDMGFPHKKVMNDFNEIWAQNTNNQKLKYVGGSIYYLFQFRLHNSHKPKIILETYGHKNPWLDEKDVSDSGMLIVARNKDEAEDYAKTISSLFNINSKFDCNSYNFSITNKFKKTKAFEIYYIIIPPLNYQN